MLVLHMKFICCYCNKIMDKSNFAEFIRDSDNKDAELHGWQRLVEAKLVIPTSIQKKMG
jgi:hypothetical protein